MIDKLMSNWLINNWLLHYLMIFIFHRSWEFSAVRGSPQLSEEALSCQRKPFRGPPGNFSVPVYPDWVQGCTEKAINLRKIISISRK